MTELIDDRTTYHSLNPALQTRSCHLKSGKKIVRFFSPHPPQKQTTIFQQFRINYRNMQPPRRPKGALKRIIRRVKMEIPRVGFDECSTIIRRPIGLSMMTPLRARVTSIRRPRHADSATAARRTRHQRAFIQAAIVNHFTLTWNCQHRIIKWVILVQHVFQNETLSIAGLVRALAANNALLFGHPAGQYKTGQTILRNPV